MVCLLQIMMQHLLDGRVQLLPARTFPAHRPRGGCASRGRGATVYFWHKHFGARRRRHRVGRVASERSRRDASLGNLQIDAGRRRSPSACTFPVAQASRRLRKRRSWRRCARATGCAVAAGTSTTPAATPATDAAGARAIFFFLVRVVGRATTPKGIAQK